MSTPGKPEVTADQPPLRATDMVGSLAALMAESGLIAAHLANLLPLPLAALGHLAVAGFLVGRYILRVQRKRDGSASLLLAFAVLVAGPFGAIGGLLIGWLSRPEGRDVERLSAWYERIALSTDLSATTRRSDRILTGRIANLQAAMPQSFSGVLEHGNVRDKQTVLGLIARRFHPDYLPALKIALVSDEPVIRVQAAAVAAKIRVNLGARADAALAAAADPTLPVDTALRHLAEAEKYVASGLMEEPDKQRAASIIDGLLASAASRIDREPATRRTAAAVLTLERYESRLLAEMRFTDFRRLRRSRVWQTRSGLRFRPLPHHRIVGGITKADDPTRRAAE
jgi:hypothetical protein